MFLCLNVESLEVLSLCKNFGFWFLGGIFLGKVLGGFSWLLFGDFSKQC